MFAVVHFMVYILRNTKRVCYQTRAFNCLGQTQQQKSKLSVYCDITTQGYQGILSSEIGVNLT